MRILTLRDVYSRCGKTDYKVENCRVGQCRDFLNNLFFLRSPPDGGARSGFVMHEGVKRKIIISADTGKFDREGTKKIRPDGEQLGFDAEFFLLGYLAR